MTPTELKILLLKKNISQSELARRIGVHRTAVSQVVNNLAHMASTRKKMAEYLGLKLSDLPGDDA